ncbi:MAG TPA: NTP transferase domain-containing protein [Caulobacteraceae bacterium]|nr:NTP transferase domain-containing protein [Caulobacteraceae bacterium]
MILAILQARMSSSRLPGKALLPLVGAPMILRQIERVSRSRLIDRLVMATSDEPEDDILAETVIGAGVAVHRGSLDDVLARFIGALDAFGPADHVVRLTADCPLADPEVIDATIDKVVSMGVDYGSNTPPERRTFPKGLDVEAMTPAALRAAAARASTPEEHEHVTWALHSHPELYRQAWLSQNADEGDVRWTVDYAHDYEFVRAVYEGLYPGRPAFTSDDVRALVRSRPDLARLGGERRI